MSNSRVAKGDHRHQRRFFQTAAGFSASLKSAAVFLSNRCRGMPGRDRADPLFQFTLQEPTDISTAHLVAFQAGGIMFPFDPH
jgi:hypothetical protein